MDIEQGVQIGDLLEILRRRKSVIVVVAGIVFLSAVVVAAVLPNEYEAWTTLLVEPQTISKRLVEAGLEESDLNSRLHLMTMQILSRGRLSRVIDDLGLYEVESLEMTREEVIALMRSAIRVDPVLPELAAGELSSDFEINTFRLFYRSDDPKKAAAVANRLANDFIEEHIKERVQISGDTSEFIESQRESLTGQIAEVERRVAAVKAANPGKLPEDLNSNHTLLERAVDNLREVQRERALAESDRSFYSQQALLGADEAGGDVDSPERRLQGLELALNQYASQGYTEKHPDVISAKEELGALRARLSRDSDDRAADPIMSRAQQNARAEAQRAGLRVASADAEIRRLESQVAEIEQRLGDTPRVAEQLSALNREYDHLYQSYQEFSAKRLEAGVAAGMERRQKGEQFRVLETAFAPPAPTSPNRPLIAFMGLVLGLALGGATAVLLEASDSSYHESRALQSSLRIPVLTTIPAILLESDRRARRRRTLRNAFAAVALTGIVLAGAVAGNWAVNGVPGPVQALIGGGGQTPPAAVPAPQG